MSIFTPNATQTEKNIAAVRAELQRPMGPSNVNLYPKTEKEFYAAQNKVVKLYHDNASTFLASKLNLNRELSSDLGRISMPKVMCTKELNSGFWSSNIENKGWGIKNISLWKTHMSGLYHVIANSIWFGTFGNNVLTKSLATLTTFLVGLFELAGIATLGVLKFARKALTSIPAFTLFVVAAVTGGLAWVFAKLFGAANPADWVREKLGALRALFTRTPAPQPNFIQRHPRLIAGAGIAAATLATGAAAWYFRGAIATGLTSATAGAGTIFSNVKNYVSEMQPGSYLTSMKDSIASGFSSASTRAKEMASGITSYFTPAPAPQPGLIGRVYNYFAGQPVPAPGFMDAVNFGIGAVSQYSKKAWNLMSMPFSSSNAARVCA